MENPTAVTEIGTSFNNSNETLDPRDVENDVLKCLNSLIVLLNVNHPRVSSVLHISSSIYPLLFEKVFGYKPIDLVGTPNTSEDEAHNVQCVIDTLSLDILGVSLSHITGEDILARKPQPIYHLLEIINEFVKASELQISGSSVSVPVAMSISIPPSHSNASHQEHFCPVCEYGLTKVAKAIPPVVDSDASLTCRSCSLLIPHQDKENSSADTVDFNHSLSHSSRGSSLSRIPSNIREGLRPKVLKYSSTLSKAGSPRKHHSESMPFNEKLAKRLVQNLEQLNRKPDSFFTTQNVPVPVNKSLDEVYKSVFQRSLRKRVRSSEKETSVLLPQYLKRRRTISKPKPFSNKKRKVQLLTKDENSTGGTLEEIKSEVPAALFTHEGLNVLGISHKRQVNLLSSRLSSLRRKITASEKMLQENISKQIHLAEIEEKDSESQERLRNVRSLRNEHLKVRGAIKNNDIQRVRQERYFDQYYLQHRRKMSNHQAKEEMVLRDLYKSRLAQQKQQIVDLSKDLREQEKTEAVSLENRMTSVQNLYHGKSEILKQRAEEKKVKKGSQIKAQKQVLEQTRRAILKQIENEVKDIQGNLERQDDFHFVESDAERLKEQWSRPK